MASAHDVARYILERAGQMSAMKLQKLVYYSQAWHLVWRGRPLFPEAIEAWAKGPVVRELYNVHRGYFDVAGWPQGSSGALAGDEKDSIDRVLSFYSSRDANWLSELTHRERPWKEARTGVRDGARSTAEIEPKAMREYYASL